MPSLSVGAHPRPQAQARAALSGPGSGILVPRPPGDEVQAVDMRRNSDAEAWSHSICIAP